MNGHAALECVDAVGFDLLAHSHNRINGIAVGQKDAGAIGQGEWCVTAFVSEKLTIQQLQQHNVCPFDQAVTAALQHTHVPLDNVVTDVVVGGPFALLQAPQRGQYGGNPPALNAQRPFRALRCGIGLTNPETTGYPRRLSVGTAGFYLTDDEGHTYVVSNSHVIAGSNRGKPGQAIVQPGTLDLTSLELMMMPTVAGLAPVKVANLLDFVPIDVAPSPPTPSPPQSKPNRVDAAIARLDIPSWRTAADIDRLTFGGRIMGAADPYEVDQDDQPIGSRVYKVGRTTGYTEGVVTNIAFRAPIPFPGGYATFVDQIAVQQTLDNVGPFSDHGDSGSGVLNDAHELVGLLFAGDNTKSLVNPIALVIDALRTQTGLNLHLVHA